MKTTAIIIMATLILSVVCSAEDSSEKTVYHANGKKRVHVQGCKRLTKDPEELAKMEKMTLEEAKKKGLPLCSRCPGSTTHGKGNPDAEPAKETEPESDTKVAGAGEITVYHVKGKKSVHAKGCRRLTKDPEELAKLTKMTLADAKKKGLKLCSKCPGSTTPGKPKPDANK